MGNNGSIGSIVDMARTFMAANGIRNPRLLEADAEIQEAFVGELRKAGIAVEPSQYAKAVEQLEAAYDYGVGRGREAGRTVSGGTTGGTTITEPGGISGIRGTVPAGMIQSVDVKDGKLTVTAGGEVFDLGANSGPGAGQTWISPDKRYLIFTKPAHTGFEAENQVLCCFDAQTGRVQSLLNDLDNVAVFHKVEFTRGVRGEPLCVASEANGGSGMSGTHVVSLASGQLLASTPGELVSISDGEGTQRLRLDVLDLRTGEVTRQTVRLTDLIAGRPRQPGIRDGDLLWEVRGEEVNLGPVFGSVSQGSFWLAPDGQTLLFSKNTGGGFENENQTLFFYNARNGQTVPLLGPTEQVAIFDRVEFATAPNGHALAIAAECDGGRGLGTVQIYDLTAGEPLGVIPETVHLDAVQSRGLDTRLTVSFEDGSEQVLPLTGLLAPRYPVRRVELWDDKLWAIGSALGYVEVDSFAGSARAAHWLSPTGRLFYSKTTGGGFENENETLYLFDGTERRAVLGPDDDIAIVDKIEFYTYLGKQLALVSESDSGLGAGTVHLLDMNTGEKLAEVEGNLVGIDETDHYDVKLELEVVDEQHADGVETSVSLRELLFR